MKSKRWRLLFWLCQIYDLLVGQISAQNSPPFAVDPDTRNVGPFSDPQRYMDVPYGKPVDLSKPVFPVSVTVRGSWAGKIVVTYAQNIHLTLEKQVVRDTPLQVSYVATLGRHEPTMPEQNPARYVPGASTSTNIDQRRIYAPAFTSIRSWAAAAPLERRFSRKVEPRCCSRTFGGWSRDSRPPRRRAFRRETVAGGQAAVRLA